VFQAADGFYFEIQIDWRERFLTLQLGRNLGSQPSRLVNTLSISDGTKYIQEVAENLNVDYSRLNKKLSSLFGDPDKFEDMADELAKFLKSIYPRIIDSYPNSL
jgi:hypothetical protein